MKTRRNLNANLSWLDLPERIGPYMAKVADFASQLEAEGFEDAVFVGCGDSSLAAETITQLSLPKRWKRLFVLDSTDPATVRGVAQDLNLERTIFIVASKSGKRVEGHALLLYFLELVRMKPIENPGRHFVVVTEEGSYLAQLATEYAFREVFLIHPAYVADIPA
jgi:transaldolase / glucose-6-phosphate isomerase